MLLCFATGWNSSSGNTGLAVVFGLLAVVEVARIGMGIVALKKAAKVRTIFGSK